MSANATHRLVEAAAALGPVDRALMNLWIHRGLDDDRIAQLTGMDAAAVAERRGRLVAELSTELGLPPDDLVAALRALAPDADADAGAGGAPAANPEPTAAAPTEDEPADPPDRLAPPEPPAAPAPVASGVTSRPRRGRIPALLTAGFVVIAIAAVVSIIATSGSSKPVARRSSTVPASTPTSVAAAPTPTTSTPTTSTSTTSTTRHRSTRRSTRRPARRARTRRSARLRPRPRLARLAGLPGGPRHVTGSVRLVGSGRHLKLRLSVTGLPHRHHSHYEVWLYDSVIDSHALGRFRVGHARTYRLPANARRYRSIDVSLQPRHARAHSGQSLLRAANPARQARRPGGRGKDSKKDRTGP